MKNILRLCAAVLCLQPALAAAQSAPAVLPYHTVYGRLGAAPGDTGPGQAIPFATLLSQLASPLQVVNGGTGLSAASGTSLPLWSTGATAGPLAYRAIVGTDLPNPSTTTLGAIFSAPVSSNSVLSGIGNDGQPTFATTTGTGDVVRATSPTVLTTFTITGANAKAFAVGRLGATTPAFSVNSLSANQITGLIVTGQSTGNGVNLSATGETNVPFAIDAAGTGGINIAGTSTGPVSIFRNTFINHDSNPTLTLGSVGGSLAHLSTPGTAGLAVTSGGGDQVKFTDTASANRQLTLTGSNGGNPTIGTTAGSVAIAASTTITSGSLTIATNTNPTLNFGTSGASDGFFAGAANTSRFLFTHGGANSLVLTGAASAVNYFSIVNSGTGSGPTMAAAGTDTDIGVSFSSKGSGAIGWYTNAFSQLEVQFLHTVGSNRWLTFTGSNGGNPTISTSAGNLAVTPTLVGSAGIQSVSPTAGIGYATGAGGAVTQITSRTTGVTLNTVSGATTMFSAAGSATAATFTVTNSTVAATDVVHLAQKSGTNLYNFMVTAIAAGSFNITFFTTGGTATDAPVINFEVIKAVAS